MCYIVIIIANAIIIANRKLTLSQVISSSMLHILSYLFFTIPHNEVGTIIITTLHMGTLKHRVVK